MAETTYPFEVRQLSAEDGGGFFVTFPDLPGCMADGETIMEAISNAMDAEESWLATAREFGDPIPAIGQSYSGKWVQRVPKSVHARVASLASREGVSINSLVASFIAEGLGRH
ncbi:MAG: type II toxin-antitoxin system HicB family antitoxin [Desulfobacteraceae bacterium]|nr:type II toxin-antitoxin system HicB family antitoxin [Desulfobacteraceae bacterium]